MPLDRQRLVKVLLQTRDPNDAVALAAARAANRMLDEAGVQWTGLISGSRAAVGNKPPVFATASHRVSVPDVFSFLSEEGYVFGDIFAMRREYEKTRWLLTEDYRKLYRLYDQVRAKVADRDEPEREF